MAVLLDIAIGIVLVVALPGADLLPQQLVVLVVLAAESDAVAPGQAQQRAEGQVGDLPDQGGGGLGALSPTARVTLATWPPALRG